ncbi:MAG: type II toxin-antitoxin system ParD family antitoxin [Planctomycetes bacterium]|nr:type II toxin-antitoxin system ParD family antitoxin [Planctomycetota bacterium]
MRTLSISISEQMRKFVEAQAEEGGFDTAGDYIRALLRQAQQQKAKVRVEALLLEGLNSGKPSEMTAQDWAEIRREVRARHTRRKGR